MKRYVFIIGLWAACFALPNALQAQWSFIATVTKTGSGLNCALDYSLLNGLTRNYVAPRSYDSKAKCEAAKQYLTSKATNCVSIECGPCTGGEGFSDEFGNSSGGFGNTNITATNQGDPFHSNNQGEAVPDAYDQKNLQNEKLLGKSSVKYGGYIGKGVAVTGDANFDAKYANILKYGRVDGFIPATRGTMPNKDVNTLPTRNAVNRRPEANDGFTAGRPGAIGGFNSPTRSSN
ncbi:MAG: hypothetical protein LBK97_01620, partial [Prevotellaceae bacterium]|nr:hypothetical protein [Prevotellaceae bacterium]